MDKELKQELTRRISQANKGELILVMYDIYFAYSNDAKKALALNDREAFKTGIHNSLECLDELIKSLDFAYDLSNQLFNLYSYCKKQLSKALYEAKEEKILESDCIMKKLRYSFEVVAASDDSEPLMANSQKVYAGFTYGRTQLIENCMDGTHRGFLA